MLEQRLRSTTMEPSCTQCVQLLAAAQRATTDHIRTFSKLQLAKLTYNHDEDATLTAQLKEAVEVRRQAIARYKEHCDGHVGARAAAHRN